MANKLEIAVVSEDVRGILMNNYHWGVAFRQDDGSWGIYGKAHTLLAKCKLEKNIEPTVWSLPGQIPGLL